MEDQRIQELIEKVLSGVATLDEKTELDTWYRNHVGEEVILEMQDKLQERDMEARGIQNLKYHIELTQPVHKVISLRRFLSVAATIAGIGFACFIYLKNKSNTKLASKEVSASGKTQENRYVVLPDSSVVLLHPGSDVKYAYNGQTREVYLTGEAFFKVKHLANCPFKVHTRKIVTTVLGTSFDITAYPNQNITVSVTSGKVGVVDEVKKTTVMLMPNQQVTISPNHNSAVEKTVQANKAIEWTSTDMDFDQMPFFLLAEKMERRYDMKIIFVNPDLKNCLITGRFDGTESLQKVLLTLNETMGTTYSIKDETIYIDGSGCN